MKDGRKKQQMVVLGLLGATALTGLYFVATMMNSSTVEFVAGPAQAKVDETLIADRTAAAAPEQSWITSSAKQVEALTLEVNKLREEANRDRSQYEADRRKILEEFGEKLAAYDARLDNVEPNPTVRGIAALRVNGRDQANGNSRAQVQTASVVPQSSTAPFFTANPNRRDATPQTRGALGPASGSPGGASTTNTARGPAAAFEQGAAGEGPGTPAPSFGVSFNLRPRGEAPTGEEVVAKKDLTHYLPSGSYAPAVVISGVDASTGVRNQGNPVPVSLRVTGPATTAGAGTTKGRKVDITGCTVLGSARGDLSSERVYVRLTKMTCLSGNSVLEADIAGYMSGSGKAGVRGQVVSREGNLTKNAAIAGALSGLASGLSSTGEAVSGADTASLNDVLKSAGVASLAEGTAGAADTLADYYISRAEQYQPVVSLYGGTRVEIVFLEGVDFAEALK